MNKDNVLLSGPFIGELGWSIMRFSPHTLYKFNELKKKYNNLKLIVCTREDRFDLYGEYASILVPLKIDGDYTKYKPDCFKLSGFPKEEYIHLTKSFYKQFSKDFNIVDHIIPPSEGKNVFNKNYYNEKEMTFNFSPRIHNKELVNQYIPNDKKLIVIAPRYREGFRRNWKYWKELYDLIDSNKNLKDKYNFVLCGKIGEYINDEKDRFYDINKIKQSLNTSLIGLTIECIKRSILTIGSQSGIPNLSMLLKTEVLEWGNQKELHTKVYNVFNTKVNFIDDIKYDIKPEIIFEEMLNILKRKA